MAQNQFQSVLRPASLEEAWSMKTEAGDAARFLGGGIDLALFAPSRVTHLIDLADLGLSEIRSEAGGLVIGSMATQTEILESPQAEAFACGVLVRAMRRVASPLQRGLATLGGTIARAHSWSDIIPVLLVLDAEVSIYDGETRTIPLTEFFGRQRQNASLILGVHLPALADDTQTAFIKYAATAFDVAALNCAARAAVRGGLWQDVRVAVGGTPALARRLDGVEQALCGQRADEGGIETAVQMAADAIDARDDIRASAEYRRSLASAGLRTCLHEMLERAEGSAS